MYVAIYVVPLFFLSQKEGDSLIYINEFFHYFSFDVNMIFYLPCMDESIRQNNIKDDFIFLECLL